MLLWMAWNIRGDPNITNRGALNVYTWLVIFKKIYCVPIISVDVSMTLLFTRHRGKKNGKYEGKGKIDKKEQIHYIVWIILGFMVGFSYAIFMDFFSRYAAACSFLRLWWKYYITFIEILFRNAVWPIEVFLSNRVRSQTMLHIWEEEVSGIQQV